jgi:hypothetical protein
MTDEDENGKMKKHEVQYSLTTEFAEFFRGERLWTLLLNY